MIATRGRKGSFVLEPEVLTELERRGGLEEAAEALVIAARQLGANEHGALEAVSRVWRRL